MIFMNGLFGYLCILIVMKWATGSTADLYHTLIYMFLSVSLSLLLLRDWVLRCQRLHCQRRYLVCPRACHPHVPVGEPLSLLLFGEQGAVRWPCFRPYHPHVPVGEPPEPAYLQSNS